MFPAETRVRRQLAPVLSRSQFVVRSFDEATSMRRRHGVLQRFQHDIEQVAGFIDCASKLLRGLGLEMIERRRIEFPQMRRIYGSPGSRMRQKPDAGRSRVCRRHGMFLA
ncbi:hypothetical protein D9T17_06775 [Lysobacter enzymogenes]|uniref:Uncharacterized protein n=1 Tax=Lysobacter enzymogenes TaxID=69 RepID=A0A3N2RK96_LYSEN|nr:hypothetical protein D9T17_06775 [Lysobacter enzymogenes]